jgi:hypothetical protein
MRRLMLIVLLTAIASSATAQRMISPPHFSSAPRSNATQRIQRGYFPLGLFSDPFYFDALSTSASPGPSQPAVIMMQAAPPPPAPVPPAQPLMIVLDGDHYIRIGETETTRVEMIEPEAFHSSTMPSHPAPQAATAAKLDPVTLIFRDGHQERVSDYTIADGILYARADYFSEGSWNKKIALAALNLPKTVEANDKQGVAFQIPTAPNEVIVRP